MLGPVQYIPIATTLVALTFAGVLLQRYQQRRTGPHLYALIFLVGGAAWSAWRFRRRAETHHRFVGNTFIAIGALLPGIGGAFTRFGHTEVLYVTEFIGLALIILGYRFNVAQPQPFRSPA